MANEPRMTGMDKEIFNATRTLTSLLNDACNHWNYLCPYLEKLAGVADDALRGYQKDYPEQVAELIDYRRKRETAVGNSAAMREALILCSRIIGANGIRGNVFLDDIQEAHKAITDALSAPARNCDLYATATEALKAQDVAFNESNFKDGECKLGCPGCADELIDCRILWLFAPAAERKGED